MMDERLEDSGSEATLRALREMRLDLRAAAAPYVRPTAADLVDVEFFIRRMRAMGAVRCAVGDVVVDFAAPAERGI